MNCIVCKVKPGKACSRCLQGLYCSKACLNADWENHHKRLCVSKNTISIIDLAIQQMNCIREVSSAGGSNQLFFHNSLGFIGYNNSIALEREIMNAEQNFKKDRYAFNRDMLRELEKERYFTTAIFIAVLNPSCPESTYECRAVLVGSGKTWIQLDTYNNEEDLNPRSPTVNSISNKNDTIVPLYRNFINSETWDEAREYFLQIIQGTPRTFTMTKFRPVLYVKCVELNANDVENNMIAFYDSVNKELEKEKIRLEKEQLELLEKQTQQVQEHFQEQLEQFEQLEQTQLVQEQLL